MSKSHEIRADFFTVEEVKGAFTSILDRLIGLKVPARNLEIGGQPLRVETISKRTDESGVEMYEGDFVKVRMDNLPVKASKTEGVSSIGLSVDEGIGEETAFIYVPSAKVFILQRNRNGASFTRAESYFNVFGKDQGDSAYDDVIGLSVIMNESAMARLGRAKALKSITFSISQLKDPGATELGTSVDYAVSAMTDLGGERATITVGLCRRNEGTLTLQSVIGTVKSLLGIRESKSGTVSKVLLRAEDDDGVALIDFIKDRLSCSDKIANDSDRHLSYNTRICFLRNAWNSKAFQRHLARVTALVSD